MRRLERKQRCIFFRCLIFFRSLFVDFGLFPFSLIHYFSSFFHSLLYFSCSCLSSSFFPLSVLPVSLSLLSFSFVFDVCSLSLLPCFRFRPVFFLPSPAFSSTRHRLSTLLRAALFMPSCVHKRSISEKDGPQLIQIRMQRLKYGYGGRRGAVAYAQTRSGHKVTDSTTNSAQCSFMVCIYTRSLRKLRVRDVLRLMDGSLTGRNYGLHSK